jgi:hypothetical protein
MKLQEGSLALVNVTVVPVHAVVLIEAIIAMGIDGPPAFAVRST